MEGGAEDVVDGVEFLAASHRPDLGDDIGEARLDLGQARLHLLLQAARLCGAALPHLRQLPRQLRSLPGEDGPASVAL